MNTNDPTAIDLSSIMRRVQKLLAIAGDSRADANEAAAAASQAEKIMRKYQLDHVEIMRADFAKADNFEACDVIVRMKMHNPLPPKLVPKWAQQIAVPLAQLHDCIVTQAETVNGRGMRFSGYKTDAQICAWTFDYLVTTIIRACREFQRLSKREKVESEAYRNGFVNSVASALRSAKYTKDAEQQASSNSRDLVVLKANAVAEKFGPARYTTGKVKPVRDAEAWRAGQRDGARVDVARRALADRREAPVLALKA
jgi:hypothetical protein